MADSLHSKVKSKDMYWFAHGGEPLPDKIPQQRSDGDEEVGSPEQHNSPSWKPLQERKVLPEEVRGSLMGKECAASVMDGTDNSPLLSSMERDDRVAAVPDATMCGNTGRAAKHMDDEKSKKVSDSEQDKNDIKAKKKMERDAAVEARRNAQRSNVSFAFGSSLPRNLDLDVTTVYQGSDLDRNKRRISQAPAATQRPEEGRLAPMHKSPYATSENMQADKMLFQSPVIQPSNCLFGSGALVADDKMSQSMISPMSACRGRRKTDLTPTIPYDRTAPPRTPVPSASSGKRSVSMTRLDQLARPRRSYVEAQRDHAKANSTSSNSSVQKEMQCSPSRPRSSASEHSVSSNRPSTTPPVNMRARTTARKPRPVSIAGTMPDRKSNVEFKKDLGTHRTPEKKKEVSTTKKVPAVNKPKSPASKNISAEKPGQKTPIKHLTPKSSPIRKPSTKSKKSATPAAHAPVEMVNSSAEEVLKAPSELAAAAAADEENGSNIPESSSKRIISEEEARAALAEKRRLAREQAEREAELERQRQEELRHQEEERIRKEEEEQRKMEEEQLRLLEEHKRQEEEKLRKAIEEQERKEQEEKLKREEEARLKAEQEKKAKEEAERQRIELEEKLRKEEEERAERKKRLEKIMSRTRGRSATSSHSGDQSDSADSQAGEAAEALSGNSSLNSIQSTDPSSGSTSLDIHPAESSQGSEHESLNSMDMIALSENSSLDSNLLMLPSDGPVSLDSDQASILSSQNFPCDEKVVSVDQNVVFSASGDNPSSCSSENETVCTDTTVILSDEKKIHDYSLVPQSESNLDSASGKLLNFDTDTVQTLVSESGDVCTENVNFPSSNQLVVENSDTSTTSHVVENLAPVSSECFTIEKKEDDTEPKHDSFTKSHEEINVPQSERYAEHDSFSAEAPVDVLCSEVSEAHESTIDSGNLSKLEKEKNVDSAELKTSPLIPPSESINLGEECNSKDADQHVEMSVTDTNKLDEDNVVPSPRQLERDHNIPIKDDESFNKVFDGNSEHYVESCDVPRLLDLSERILDGNSENVGNITLSQPITPPGTGPFDENSEQYINNVDMSRSLNVVFSPSAEIKPVIGSGDNSLFPKERDSAMISMEDSAGVTTSVKILEPSAIHTKANQSGEYFVAASVTDSEDSSLDSNLSQIMNVNIIQSVTSVEKGALNGSPSDTAAELPDKNSDLSTSSLPFQKLPPYVNDNIPTTNGHQSCMVESFSYGNGVDDDCKTSSLTGDHHPVSSLINNEINSNIVSSINNRNVQNILNSGDINFNKVPSNPFLTTNEASEVSENQLLNQEEIVRNPFQTESHA